MKKTTWIARTAVCLALLLAVQFFTKSLGQLVTGSCVNLVLAVAALIGGGMGRSETCGCVTGAYMALGYKFANDQAGDVDKLNYAKGKREAFNKRFIEKFGSLNCCDMLGGLHNCRPEELAVIKEQNLYETICTRAVNYACALTEELLDEG